MNAYKKLFHRIICLILSISLMIQPLALPLATISTVYAQEEATPASTMTTSVVPETASTNSPTPSDQPPSDTPIPTTPATSTTDITPTPAPTASNAAEATQSATPTSTPDASPSATTTVKDTESTESAALSKDKTALRKEGTFLKKSIDKQQKNYVEGEVIVKFKADKVDVKSTLGKVQAFAFEKKFSLEKKDEIKSSNIQVFKSKKSTSDIIKTLKDDPNVERAQPNYIYTTSDLGTTDTYKTLLWGIENTAQSVPGTYSPTTGTTDKDIDAKEAWAIHEGSGVIVAVIDTGVAYNHPDLVGNMWDGSSCKNELGNALGGCSSGYDFEDNDKTPLPSTSSHGTHIAGTIAAVKNNAKGIVGVAPQTKIMAIKTSLTTDELIKGIQFAQQNGAKIINASWGGSTNDVELQTAIDGFSGIFIAASGNDGTDNDTSHKYPCDYSSSNIVCVSATDQNDSIASFSNYGATSVDVGAPGTNIYSTMAESIQFSETFENVAVPNIGNKFIQSGNLTWGTKSNILNTNKAIFSDYAFWGQYQNNTNSVIESQTINLNNKPNSNLSFTIFCDTEQNYDGIIMSFFNGSVWLDIDAYTGNSGGEIALSYPLQNYISSVFKIKYEWITDGSFNDFQGCYIDNIEVTSFSDGSDESYGYMNGTSMAAPHASALAALIWGTKPSLTTTQVKDRILQTGDSVPSLAGKTVTGKRINAFNALNGLNNTPPTTSNSSVTTLEDTAKSITLSGSDANGDALIYSVVTAPTKGTLGTITGNTVLYTPTANANGADSFTFKAYDGKDYSNISTVSITITPVNDTPSANSQPVNTTEDTPVEITLSGSDVDGDSLTYTKGTGPAHGTLGTISGNTVTYTPNTNYVGSDSFTFTVKDATLTSTPATVNISVATVNDPPVLSAIGNKSVNELTNLTFTISATDPDSTPNFSMTTLASATVNATTGVFSFTPTEAQGPNSYSVTFTVTDGTSSDSETITITVNEVNVAPVANNVPVTTPEDTTKNISLNATDSDVPAQSINYFLTSNPANGSLDAISNGTINYTPNANFSGTDSFKYKVNDGVTDSNEATVTITVTAVNDKPTISTITDQSTNEDTVAGPIAFTVGDIDNPVGSMIIGATSSNIALVTNLGFAFGGSGANRTISITPLANQSGTTTVTVTVSDGALSTSTSFVLTVTAVNDSPTITTITDKTINEDSATSALPFTISDIDTTVGNLIVTGVSSNAALVPNANIIMSGTGTNRTVTITPLPNTFGSSNITITVSDGTLVASTTFTLTVNSINDIPVANAQSITTMEGVAKDITLTGTDADGDTLTYQIVSDPLHGTLEIVSNGVVRYTPTANYMGNDSFTFRVNDGTIASALATVSIEVTEYNDPPELLAIGNKSVDELTNLTFTLTATDPDSTPSFSMTTLAGATVNPTTGVFSFTPTEAQGPNAYSMTFTVSDGTSSDSETITITVNEVNAAPVAHDVPVTTPEDTTIQISLDGTDSDIPAQSMSYIRTSDPANGSVDAISNGTINYTPNSNLFGTDSFTYKVNDGVTDSAEGTVTITVTPVNDDPKANNDTATTDEDTTLTIAKTTLLANDTDTEGATLTITAVANPIHGTVSISGANILFTPTANYFGTAAFGYTISDGTMTDSAVVTVTVTSVNDAPIANAQSVTMTEDTTEPVTLTGTDVDGDTISFYIVTPPSHGTLDAITDGVVHYSPNANFTGTDSFTFRVKDQTDFSTPVTVGITVEPVNDSPVLSTIGNKSVDELSSLTFTLTATDPDSTPSFSMTNSPAGATINPTTGVFSFTPTEAQGPNAYSVTFTVFDGDYSDSETITITVNEVNVAPVAQDVTVTTPEDTVKNITLNGTDSDIPTQTINYFLVTNPTNGSVDAISNGTINYTPDSNFFGTDSFTYKVNDGSVDSTTSTVTITVTAVNDGPVATDDTAITVEDTVLLISANTLLLNDYDSDSASITLSSVKNPTHGSVTFDGTNVIFTPESNFSGIATFDYVITDGTLTATGNVAIIISAVNDAPSATNQSVSTPQDTATNIVLTGTDVDGDTLAYSVKTNPTNGTLSAISGNSMTYTPNTGYLGADSFTFTVSDGSLESEDATVAITVHDPLLISNEATHTVQKNVATITWLTNRASTSRVVYDTSSHADIGAPSKYGYKNSTEEDGAMVLEHSVQLQNLDAGTTYYFRVVSHASPEMVGKEYAFTTEKNSTTSDSNNSSNTSNNNSSSSSNNISNAALSAPFLAIKQFITNVPWFDTEDGLVDSEETISPIPTPPPLEVRDTPVLGASTCQTCIWWQVLVLMVIALSWHFHASRNKSAKRYWIGGVLISALTTGIFFLVNSACPIGFRTPCNFFFVWELIIFVTLSVIIRKTTEK